MPMRGSRHALVRAGKDTNDESNYAAFYRERGNPREVPSLAAAMWARAVNYASRPAILLASGAVVLLIVTKIAFDRRHKRSARAKASVPMG
jgi:hypothetical protein